MGMKVIGMVSVASLFVRREGTKVIWRYKNWLAKFWERAYFCSMYAPFLGAIEIQYHPPVDWWLMLGGYYLRNS